jgi:hypothetical protein
MTHFYSKKCENEIRKVTSSPIHSRVLYIGLSKRLNDYYALRPNTLKNGKGGVAGSDVAHCIDPSVFNLPPTQPP